MCVLHPQLHALSMPAGAHHAQSFDHRPKAAFLMHNFVCGDARVPALRTALGIQSDCHEV